MCRGENSGEKKKKRERETKISTLLSYTYLPKTIFSPFFYEPFPCPISTMSLHFTLNRPKIWEKK